MARIAVVIAMLAQGAVSVAQQTAPPAATRVVTLKGRVVTADDRPAPVRRAAIEIASRGQALAVVYSDGQGRFDAPVPAGVPYTLRASKAGLVPSLVSPPIVEETPESPFEISMTRAGVIAGRVRGQQGEPVPNVTVRARRISTASGAGEPPSSDVTAQTDDIGEYRLSGLPVGSYSVGVPRSFVLPSGTQPTILIPPGANVPEFIKLVENTPPPADVVVDVASGREASAVHDGVVGGTIYLVASAPGAPVDARLASMSRVTGGAVSGTILDEFGEPIEGIDVELRPITLQSDGGALSAGVGGRRTDDLGRFRLFGIQPGTYYLTALPGLAGGASRYAPVYYPGRAQLADAFVVAVEEGKEVTALSLSFALLNTARVRGFVFDKTGQPLVGNVVLAATLPVGVVSLPGFAASISSDGSFELPNVPEGDYVLQATGRGSTGSREFGLEHVRVAGAGVDAVVISTTPGSKLTGRVSFDGDDTAKPGTSLGLSVSPADPAYTPARTVYEGGFVDKDLTFEMTGLVGPGRFALEGARPGWWLKSVTIDGVDVTDNTVTFGAEDYRDVTAVIATTGGSIEGRITGPQSVPLLRASVVVFSIDESRWFYRSRYLRLARLNTDGSGRFSVSGLPPGEYWIAAAETSFQEGAYTSWQHPEFLSRLLPVARRVRLREREKVEVQLPPR